jgi:type I restriction enzyme, S subunit
MTSNWIKSTLGTVAVFKSGKTPSKSNPAYWSGSIPWISASSMEGNRYSNSALKVTEAAIGAGSMLLDENTVLLLVRGSTLHNRIPVGITTASVTFNQDVKAVIPKDDSLLPWFLLYWLMSIENKLLGLVEDTGIGAGKLDTKVLKDLEILIPPVNQQTKLIKFFKSIDDKIILNQQTNQTIESIAQAIFKSWFVDFDPVKAKMGGREPDGMDTGTAALIPNRLVESDLGMIPDGWEASTFGSIIERKKQRVNNQIAKVLSAVSSGELVDSDDHFKKRVYSKSIEKYLKVDQWDFAYNPSRINIGSIGMLDRDLSGAVSPIYIVFRSIHYRWLVWFHLKRSSIKDEIGSLCSGSVRQSLNYKDFASMGVVLPPLGIFSQFEALWTSSLALIDSNKAESKKLSELRDSLLQKLISGEIQILSKESP